MEAYRVRVDPTDATEGPGPPATADERIARPTPATVRRTGAKDAPNALEERVHDSGRRLRVAVDDHLADAMSAIARGEEAVGRSRARLERSEVAIADSSRRINREQAEIDRETARSDRDRR